MNDVLTRLGSEIDSRRHGLASESYTASLFARGEDAILKKVGEEAVEFLLAAKGDDSDHLVAEAADVWFHMLVLLSAKGLGPADVLNELQRREGISGLAEKASRVID
ncbi:MAG: phosphoribosyl-ATP diphosphatase [Granulosicoccus sp.]|nr:phosphoribosyl-ATP diphosphatase [Granulosicoccus sp.]